MSAETVAFAELVRAAAHYTRLWCQHCQADQAHQLHIVLVEPMQSHIAQSDYATNGDYWACVRCGNVQNWTMG